jgi:hypothetical protein
MLGSNHVGERENAAWLVEQFRRQRGLNWGDLLVLQPVHADAPDPRQPHYPDWASSERALPMRYRGQDLVWCWSMLLGLALVDLMSLTSLAQNHAAEKQIKAATDER